MSSHLFLSLEILTMPIQSIRKRDGLGPRAEVIQEYPESTANRRLERLGLPAPYAAKNPFPWMSEIIDIRKEKNFFETASRSTRPPVS